MITTEVVWRTPCAAPHFWPVGTTNKTHVMNPVAFVAFLMGINTTAPAPKPAVNNEQPGVATAQPVKQPAANVPGTLKRGGWDRN